MRIASAPLFILVFSAIMFGIAGRWDWWGAWAFLALFMGMMAGAIIWAVRKNPGLINERGRIGQNTKGWDKILMGIYTLLLIGLLVTAGFDARFHWSSVPVWMQVVGGVMLALGIAVLFWVARTNPYLSLTVRIQDDRGQSVVSSGPYRFVRHPMYSADLFLFWGIPILLGSWWALVPWGLIVVVFVIRTALEDRTLQAELPGYAEYAKRIRYRLVPGVW
jgi:protein-S-isoprenylcysteine O-methyltransferase Ste14